MFRLDLIPAILTYLRRPGSPGALVFQRVNKRASRRVFRHTFRG